MGATPNDLLERLRQNRTLAVAVERRMRTFRLERREDVSKVSGTGTVAEGVEFSDGRVAMRWLSQRPTTTLFESIEDLIWIHGHGGTTEVVYDEPEAHLGGADVA
jgi:hypothetical protein